MFAQNDELGLDLRSLVSGTVGRYLVQRQDREWRAGAGLAVSRERRADGTTVESIELPLTTSLRLFRLDSPKTDVKIELAVLPSLTESGRVRGEASVNARHEIIHDLFFEISLYDSYDNRPPRGFGEERLERRHVARLLDLKPANRIQVAPAARSAASDASS